MKAIASEHDLQPVSVTSCLEQNIKFTWTRVESSEEYATIGVRHFWLQQRRAKTYTTTE
jgi:hypothetical protein